MIATQDQKATAVQSKTQLAVFALSATLPQQGLDRMTEGKVESVICTSALTGHI